MGIDSYVIMGIHSSIRINSYIRLLWKNAVHVLPKTHPPLTCYMQSVMCYMWLMTCYVQALLSLGNRGPRALLVIFFNGCDIFEWFKPWLPPRHRLPVPAWSDTFWATRASPPWWCTRRCWGRTQRSSSGFARPHHLASPRVAGFLPMHNCLMLPEIKNLYNL